MFVATAPRVVGALVVVSLVMLVSQMSTGPPDAAEAALKRKLARVELLVRDRKNLQTLGDELGHLRGLAERLGVPKAPWTPPLPPEAAAYPGGGGSESDGVAVGLSPASQLGADTAAALPDGQPEVVFEGDGCAVTRGAARERCLFPFFHGGRTHTTCMTKATDSYCAAEIDPATGDATRLERCSLCPVAAPEPQGGGSGDDACAPAAGCPCHRYYSSQEPFVVACTHPSLSCRDVCDAAAAADVAVLREQAKIGELFSLIIDNWVDPQNRPASNEDLDALIRHTPLAWDAVSHHFSGTGVVFFTGSARLPSALATALFIRNELRSNVPIEIWHAEGETEPTAEMRVVSRAHRIYHKRVPRRFSIEAFRWGERWERDGKHVLSEAAGWAALKPYVAMASSFETVIFLDDDAIPAVDPLVLKALLRGDETAVFWRDVWSLFKKAAIWDVVPWPGGESAPAQDSGVFVACKACGGGKGWEGLATAAYLNFYHAVFYPAIYFSPSPPETAAAETGDGSGSGGGGGAAVGGGSTAFGIGDKDTLQVAYMAKKVPYRMMGPLQLVGPAAVRCGPTLGQPGADGKIVVLHMNSHKLTYSDWASGMWRKWKKKYGFALQRVAALVDPEEANVGDGLTRPQIKWKGVKNSGATRCMRFIGKASYSKLSDHFYGRDIEADIKRSFAASFELPWMALYIENSPAAESSFLMDRDILGANANVI